MVNNRKFYFMTTYIISKAQKKHGLTNEQSELRSKCPMGIKNEDRKALEQKLLSMIQITKPLSKISIFNYV